MSSPALIRAQVEARLAARVPAAFGQRPPVELRTMPTGVGVIDTAIGGIPCGGITEIVGPALCSAGRQSLQAQLLAGATREQFCALVDATDSFDPRSAQTAGVNLERVLWIRGGGRGVKALEQAFKASDLLLQGSGGFVTHRGRSRGNIRAICTQGTFDHLVPFSQCRGETRRAARFHNTLSALRHLFKSHPDFVGRTGPLVAAGAGISCTRAHSGGFGFSSGGCSTAVV